MRKLIYPSLAGAEDKFALLDLIPDTHAWVKDRDGKFVYGNQLFYERFGLSSLQGLLGKTDYDIAPAHMARGYRTDDDAVLGGRMVRDRLELINSEDKSVAWFLTSKWPIYNPQDDIIGSLGLSHHLDKSERKTVPLRELREPINYIYSHFAEAVTVDILAKVSNLSVSALERRFKKHFNLTPHQYLNGVRLENARRLLVETDKHIGTIALDTGFSDHSHFTRNFTHYFGVTPSQVRKAR